SPRRCMDRSNIDLSTILQRARDGDESAAQQIVELYDKRLRAVIRRHLNAKARPVHDPDTVAQEVWFDFFRHLQTQQIPTDPDALGKSLCSMARNRTLAVSREACADKRDSDRTVSLADLTAAGGDEPCDHRPDPADQAAADDLWSRLLGEFDPTEQT